ncbi:MAG TPA: periplasmic heavy metal sensor [Opitutaceae bacterium]|nr:periplasmic heavy metal sensor [Opitutaceae bacterium]
MRRLAAFLVLIVAVAAGAYGVTRYVNSRQPPEDQWTWLRREFELTPAQLARIQALHAAYAPVCADHCSRIMAAQTRLTALIQAGRQDTPEYRAVLDQWEAVRRECNAATLRQLQAVAAAMEPAEGRRYLAMMEPRVATRDHLGPLGVR